MKKPRSGQSPTPDAVQPTTPSPPPELEELLRVKDLTRLLKISRTTLYRLVRDRKLDRPLRLGVNIIAWRRSTIATFLKGKENV